MIKRLFVIGFLILGVVALMATNVVGACRSIGGRTYCGSVCLEQILKGVGNPGQRTVAVCGGFYVDKVSAKCWNQPLNATKAQGTSFSPGINLSSSGYLEAVKVSQDERGNTTASICWECQIGTEGPGCVEVNNFEALLNPLVLDWIAGQLTECDPTMCTDGPCFDAIAPEGTTTACCKAPGLCRNNNWWFDPCPDTLKIETVYAYYSTWQRNSQTGMMELAPGSLCQKCVPDTDPTNLCGFSCYDISMTECVSREMLEQCTSRVGLLPE
jgi:hypothetical protein